MGGQRNLKATKREHTHQNIDVGKIEKKEVVIVPTTTLTDRGLERVQEMGGISFRGFNHDGPDLRIVSRWEKAAPEEKAQIEKKFEEGRRRYSEIRQPRSEEEARADLRTLEAEKEVVNNTQAMQERELFRLNQIKQEEMDLWQFLEVRDRIEVAGRKLDNLYERKQDLARRQKHLADRIRKWEEGKKKIAYDNEPLDTKDLVIVDIKISYFVINCSFSGERVRVTFTPKFLSSKGCEALTREFNGLIFATDWNSNGRNTGRRTLHFAEYGLSYTYAKQKHIPLPLPKILKQLVEYIRGLDNKFKYINYVVVNLYQAGHVGMGPHSDSEEDIVQYSPIISISIGASRKFKFTLKNNNKYINRNRIN